MENEIVKKLRDELDRDINGEPQVIYILSSVRKLMESDRINGGLNNYKVLKFYCDWALHAEINNTTAVASVLQEIIDGKGPAVVNFALAFNALHTELYNFLRQHGLRGTLGTGKSRTAFNRILSQIYADTPLIIRGDPTIRLTWKPVSAASHYGGYFTKEKITGRAKAKMLSDLTA